MKALPRKNRGLKIKTLIFIFLIIIGLGFISFSYENKVSYIDFADEEENIVTGQYLLQGKKMYKDIFSQHQPIPAIFSAAIQKVTSPNSIFLLVKRHREFIIAWAFIWALILVLRFGFWTAGFIFSYELTKIFLLGNLFLAESLIVYPLCYLVGLALSETKDKPSFIELFFLGLIFSSLAFSFLPIWPLLILLLVFLTIKYKIYNWKKIGLIVLGALPILIMVILFIRIPDYFNSVFVFNSKYYIPLNKEQLSIFTFPKSFFGFLLPFFSSTPATLISKVIKVFSLCFIVLSFLLLLKKRKIYFLIFAILGLANIRYVQPGLDYYRGFHLIVWYSLLIFTVFWGINFAILNTKKKRVKTLLIFFGMCLVIFSLIVAKHEIFAKRNVGDDYYINYSKQVDLGEAVRILKSPNDTLFVAPDQMLIYWQGGIINASKYIFYYPFMDQVLVVQEDVALMFKNSSPTFVYCEKELFPNLSKYLHDYFQLKKDGKFVDLYISKTKLLEVDKDQIEKLDYYNFSLPSAF